MIINLILLLALIIYLTYQQNKLIQSSPSLNRLKEVEDFLWAMRLSVYLFYDDQNNKEYPEYGVAERKTLLFDQMDQFMERFHTIDIMKKPLTPETWLSEDEYQRIIPYYALVRNSNTTIRRI